MVVPCGRLAPGLFAGRHGVPVLDGTGFPAAFAARCIPQARSSWRSHQAAASAGSPTADKP